MGIVRNQGIKNMLSAYTGVVLGYINVILLFPAYFTSEQFGLINLLISVSFVYTQFSSVGLVNAISKYFPFFKTDDKRHNFFLTYIIVLSVSGFFIITLLFFVFKPLIIDAYINNSKLFVDYFLLLIPLAFSLLVYVIFETLARVIFRTVLANFIREVVIRILTTADIVLFIYNIVDFTGFIYVFVGIYMLSALIIVLQVIISREFKFIFSIKGMEKRHFVEFLRYGTYNLFSGAAMFVGQKVDIIMIGSMIGLSIVGAYSLYLFIATVISIPMRAFSKIAIPIIANSWKENDIKQINDIYKRTSLIQMILGMLLYIGVIINKHNLFIIVKKTEYIENFDIFYFLGIAFLIDVAVGLNSEIISSSKYYKYDALFNLIMLVVSIATNFIFIPILGGVGAAIAAATSFFVFNFSKWLFLYIKYKMQPVDFKQLFVLILGFVCVGVNYFIPQLNNVYLDIIFRNGIITLIFMSVLYFTKMSFDLNDRINTYINLIIHRKNF